MAQEPLVEANIQAGRELIARLKNAGVQIEGAFWSFTPEIDRWKLLIASRDAKSGGTGLYRKMLDVGGTLDVSSVQFVSPLSPLYKALENATRHRPAGDIRISQSMVDGVYVDDALVYHRIAA